MNDFQSMETLNETKLKKQKNMKISLNIINIYCLMLNQVVHIVLDYKPKVIEVLYLLNIV